MNTEPPPDRRATPDRRRRPTRPWDAFRGPARRVQHRRHDGPRRHHFVDRHSPLSGVLSAALLVLCVADGLLTLLLIDLGCEEANPLMAAMLDRGALAFLASKYALTAVGLLVLIPYEHYRMFGTRFRVGYLIPALVGLYCVLLTYQLSLFRRGAPGALAAREPQRAARAGVEGGAP